MQPPRDEFHLRHLLPDVPRQVARIVAEHPHDPDAFTQGLVWVDGGLYESTGRRGRSELRELNLADGAVLRRAAFPDACWGEGLAAVDDELVALTLDSGQAMRWRRADFAPRAPIAMAGVGWGLARCAEGLAVSDGSSLLRFVDPHSLQTRRTLRVTEAGVPVERLNALAAVRGELFANVFMTEYLVRIDAQSGEVRARVDLSGIVARSGRRHERDVANGIAWDERSDRLFVTGKCWPRLFEIRLP